MKLRCNFIDTEREAGADTRALVELMTTQGELVAGNSSTGRSSDPFWQQSQERMLYNTIEAVTQSGEPVSAPSFMSFITNAAYSPAMLADPGWQQKFHNQCMTKAARRQKTTVQEHDFRLIVDYWNNEFPSMDDRPRTSIIAGVMNTLHMFNTGLVRDLCSTTTNFTPAVFDRGVSVLANFPFSRYGPTGRFLAGGLMFITQRHVLRRAWDPGGYFNVIVCDEFQESVTEFCARYLAQCRSHGGSMFCLTQTINSEYGALSGATGHHKADSLLSQFGHHIYHTCDAKTAKFASELLGQRLEIMISGSPDNEATLWDEMMGRARMKCSFSENYHPVLQPRIFQGMRCGGPPHFVVDGIAIRAGTPFNCGEQWQWVQFPQR